MDSREYNHQELSCILSRGEKNLCNYQFQSSILQNVYFAFLITSLNYIIRMLITR